MSLNRNRSEFFVDNPLSDNWLAADEITDSAHDKTDINLDKLASIKNGEILYEMFWNDKNGQQIAKKIGISREAVRQRKEIAMNQLRKRLGSKCLTETPLL
jgi:DNA-directed RNA polymerase specialized sigma subunit